MVSHTVKLLMLLCLSFTTSVSAATQQITIVYTGYLNHITSPQGSYAQLATLLKTYRQQEPTLFLFGGSSLAPSLMSSLDRGAHIIDLLNDLEPNAMAVADREFTFSIDELSLRAYEAAFPMVLSNVTDTLTGKNHIDGIKRSLIIKKNGIKIGILASDHSSDFSGYALSRLHVDDGKAVITQQAQALRQQGAQLVILMAHKNTPHRQSLLDDSVVDIILRQNPFIDSHTRSQQSPIDSDVFINKPNTAAAITITWPQAQPEQYSITTQLVPLAELPADPFIQQQVKDYSRRFSILFNQPLTQLTSSLDLHRSAVRTSENAFGNVVTDAMRIGSHSDIALINGGTIRTNKTYPSGYHLTYGDVLAALSYRDHIQILKITGQQLQDALENGVSKVGHVEGTGAFPQVSGMSFHVDFSKPKGKRISRLLIHDKSVQLDQDYTLATSDFLREGGDGYTSFMHAETVAFSQQATPLISDVVINFLRRKPTLSAPQTRRIFIKGANHD